MSDKTVTIVGIICIYFLLGCMTGVGPVSEYPSIMDPDKVATIIVWRGNEFIGGGQSVMLTIDGVNMELFRVGHRISLKLDPGEYLFGVKCHGGWGIADNVHEVAQELEVGKTYIFRIYPNMSIGCGIQRTSQDR